jgi:phosphoribosylaminoimidazole-succinocarboxamide synthase
MDWATEQGLEKVGSGKVREIYRVGPGRLLLVASNRISAFDVIMHEEIPKKGRVLTGLSAYWCQRITRELGGRIKTHFISVDPTDLPRSISLPKDLDGRWMLVREANMLPLEMVVRGYLAGSAWEEYKNQGTVHGMEAPRGLLQSQRLAEPMVTPSTKATEGHDENINASQAISIVGKETYEKASAMCLEIFEFASAHLESVGIVLADTKFELGWIDGELCLCDEVLTPDSSRFWPKAKYEPGTNPPSLDKQPLRDWLATQPWDRKPPPPTLPEWVLSETSQRYLSCYAMITGNSL